MKRVSGLYSQIAAWDNLRTALWKASLGHRGSAKVQQARADPEKLLSELHGALESKNWPQPQFHQFTIYDPKERLITAPCFRDRVLHHSIMNVCEPYFEKWLIPDTFACRVGKGRLKALERATEYAQRHTWFLKADIRKYFQSIPHENLLAALERKFKDHDFLDLLRHLALAGHQSRGLPIGSLLSQHLANFYLGPLDRLCRETWKMPGYVRYMDDFTLWHDDKTDLVNRWRALAAVLGADFGLELNPKTHLNHTRHGMDFCGFRVFPGWRELNRRSRRRLITKHTALEKAGETGVISQAEQQTRSTAIFAFAMEGKSWHFRKRMLAVAPTA